MDDIAIATLDTPLGRMVFGCTADGLCGLSFRDTPRARARLCRGLPEVQDPSRTDPVRDELARYFAGESRDIDVPIDWRHTSGAQREVLEKLHASVRYGETVTYGGLAGLSGTGLGAREVGTVMGSNPIPIVVPCHRVVASDGIGGYGGGNGIEVKRWLLTLEGALPATLDWDPATGPA